MNRLIIVGNGFDLSLGLKTSYLDFLYDFLKGGLEKCLTPDPTHVDLRGVSSYSNELIDITIPNDKRETIKEKIHEIKTYSQISSFLINNKFLTYKFQLLEELHHYSLINGWTDIEVLYYDILISKLKEKDIVKRELLISKYNRQFEFLKNELIKYLKNIMFNFLDENFYGFMYNYCENLSEPYNDDGRKEEINNYMFLNFNYTSTLSKSLNIVPVYNSSINYIHGHLDSEDSIIFGFGDEHDTNYQIIESERSRELFKNIKSVHYFKYPNYKRLKSFIDSDNYDVYILGHSCGISDRTLFNEILENDKCLSIKLLHHKIDNSKTDFFEKSIEIMRHFKDKKGMRKKIQTFNERDQIPQFTPKFR